jgi:zinc D-Ala-D-Ala carboxypeptidase
VQKAGLQRSLSLPIKLAIKLAIKLLKSLFTQNWPGALLMKLFSLIPKRFRFLVITAVTAVAIVISGLVLRVSVLKASAPADALNDTRSPIAEELRQPPTTAAPTLPPGSPTVALAPGTAPNAPDGKVPDGGTDSAFALPNSTTTPQAGDGTVAPEVAIALASAKENFGHLPYGEADPARLQSIGTFEREGYERPESLDYEAAQAFTSMQVAAEAEGVKLMPVSGFRSIEEQKALFDNQIERKGGVEAAAQYSAPAGHSEHHTGYALDITDGNQPESDLKHSFETTNAYQWLLVNAQIYQFEQSFPKANTQGVTFEPWHWRYIGSAQAAQTFEMARSLYPSS